MLSVREPTIEPLLAVSDVAPVLAPVLTSASPVDSTVAGTVPSGVIDHEIETARVSGWFSESRRTTVKGALWFTTTSTSGVAPKFCGRIVSDAGYWSTETKFCPKVLVNAVAVMVTLLLPTAVIVVVAANVGENVITPVASVDQVQGWLGMVVAPESFTTQLALTCRPRVWNVENELGLRVAELGICFTRIEIEE